MINVSGSISAVNILGKEFELNATDQFKDFELNTVSRFDYNYDDDDSKVTINLINQENSDSFYQQIDQSDELLAITCIDNGSTQQLKSLLSNECLVTRVIGLQGHCYNGDLESLESDRVFRLSQMRRNIDLSEIVLRTSDVAVFNMNCIRRGDQCTYLKSNTTGFTIEEACLISKYIGASKLINKVYFTGLNFNQDDYGMMTTNLVNLLWYFAEGLKFRAMDSEIENPENLVFSVVAEEIEKELQFVKSSSSGRWWLKVPTEKGEMHMACSHRDYEDACNNEFSDRIMKAILTSI